MKPERRVGYRSNGMFNCLCEFGGKRPKVRLETLRVCWVGGRGLVGLRADQFVAALIIYETAVWLFPARPSVERSRSRSA